jgi:hypothetical protein
VSPSSLPSSGQPIISFRSPLVHHINTSYSFYRPVYAYPETADPGRQHLIQTLHPRRAAKRISRAPFFRPALGLASSSHIFHTAARIPQQQRWPLKTCLSRRRMTPGMYLRPRGLGLELLRARLLLFDLPLTNRTIAPYASKSSIFQTEISGRVPADTR